MELKESTPRERKVHTLPLLIIVFTVSFVASALICTWLLPIYVETVAGLRTEDNTIYFTPRRTFNDIQEWAPRRSKEGEPAEWGIRVRPNTPAAVETVWHDKDGDTGFDWMEMNINLGGNLSAKISLDLTNVFSPVEVACSRGENTWDYRDIDGDGMIDILFERHTEKGKERLVEASAWYDAAYYNVLLDEPFDDDECTIKLPDNSVKNLVFIDGLWEPRPETSDGEAQ